MAIFPKLTYKFNPGSIKILAGFLAEINKLILKLTWKSKGPRIAKTISKKKKNSVGGLTLPNFKAYYKATVVNISIRIDI